MAHFAQLDENNVVINVIVVHNNDCLDENGNESEQVGINFCKSLLGANTRWIQTSYNGNVRYRYAGVSYTYDPELDIFIHPAPYPSWEYSTIIHEWEAPVAMPMDVPVGHHCVWNEENLQWDVVPIPTE